MLAFRRGRRQSWPRSIEPPCCHSALASRAKRRVNVAAPAASVVRHRATTRPEVCRLCHAGGLQRGFRVVPDVRDAAVAHARTGSKNPTADAFRCRQRVCTEVESVQNAGLCNRLPAPRPRLEAESHGASFAAVRVRNQTGGGDRADGVGRVNSSSVCWPARSATGTSSIGRSRSSPVRCSRACAGSRRVSCSIATSRSPRSCCWPRPGWWRRVVKVDICLRVGLELCR